MGGLTLTRRRQAVVLAKHVRRYGQASSTEAKISPGNDREKPEFCEYLLCHLASSSLPVTVRPGRERLSRQSHRQQQQKANRKLPLNATASTKLQLESRQ